MKKEELTAALDFFIDLQTAVGTARFLEYKEMILAVMERLVEAWMYQGRNVCDLFHNTDVFYLMESICNAQETLNELIYDEEEDN